MPNAFKDPLGWLGWLLSFPVAVAYGVWILVTDWWFTRRLMRDVRRALGLPRPPIRWRRLGRTACRTAWLAVEICGLLAWFVVLWWLLGYWSLAVWIVFSVIAASQLRAPLTPPRPSR